jgi:tetratricopeptide (TPR) repeat protein
MPLPEDGFWERLSGVFAREPDGHVRFKRPALQEVAYESLPFKLRRQLHMSVGLRLERDQDQELDANPAILSHHFSLAGDQDRAYRYAMAAAERATDAFSHADAAKLYRRAIDAGRALFATRDRAALGEAWEQLGEALRASGEPVPAARAFTQARHLLRDDPLAQARLYERQAEVAKRSGALTAAVRWLLRGFRQIDGIAGSQATSSRARMRSNLAGIRVRQGKRTEAIAACREAIAEAESVAELPALAHACYVLDWALVESGRSAEANHSQRALEIYQQLGDAEHEHMVLNNLGMFAYFDGRWGDAVALYQQAGECSDRAGRPADTAYIDCNLGEILSDQGRLDDAEEHLQRARRIWSGTRDGPAVAFIDLLLARLATRRGDYGRALPMLEAATEDLRRYRVDGYVGFGRALIAEAEAVAGDPFKAMESASSELRANDRLRPLLSRVGGLAFARLGDKDAAIRELTHAARAARERDAAYDLAITIDVLDRLGAADSQLREERDAVVKRLNIARLPTPTPA